MRRPSLVRLPGGTVSGWSAGPALLQRAVGHGRAGPLQLQAGQGHAATADGPGAGIEAPRPAVAPVDQSQQWGHEKPKNRLREQEEQLREYVAHHLYPYSPFYRRRFDTAGIAPRRITSF